MMKVTPGVSFIPNQKTWGPALKSPDHIKDLEKARICPNDLYLTDLIKPNKYSDGIWGVASDAYNLRSNYTLSMYAIESQILKLIQQAKQAKDEETFKEIEKKINSLQEQKVVKNNYMTKNQTTVIDSVADGQPIPTIVEGDALEDERIPLDEFKKVFPSLHNLNQRPELFNFNQFSIQRKPSTVQKIVESQFSKTK